MHASWRPNKRCWPTCGLFMAVALFYLIFAFHGGIRSPDSEVVFRTARALAVHGTWAVDAQLEWAGFGLAPGDSGALYSVFGPGQALVLAPLVAVATHITSAWELGAHLRVPPSHYVPGGLQAAVQGDTGAVGAAHGERFLVSMVNPLISAAAVSLFYLLCRRLGGSTSGAQFTALLFGLGSLQLPYAGTMFSEPLATLFVLLAFYLLLEPGAATPGIALQRGLLAGIALGGAVLTHLTAVLFAPFALGLIVFGGERSRRVRGRCGLGLAVGLGAALLLLGLHNYLRFGNPLETGRNLADKAQLLGYGTFVWPGPGLSGLLISAGKGVVWYCPAVLLGALCLPAMYRVRPLLASGIVAMVSTRILFIACRSDWHGGFCVGPRYLVMILPFMLLPCATCATDFLARGQRRRFLLLSAAAFLCIVEQVYLSLGEVFTFLHMLKWTALARHVDIFVTETIYRSWEFSPLLHLWRAGRGPWLLQGVPLSNLQLLALLTALLGLIWIALTRMWLQRQQRDAPKDVSHSDTY